MGAVRISTVIVALIMMLTPLHIVYGKDMEEKFPDIEAINHWAKKQFFGGYESKTFNRDDKEVLVVVGMPTSGFSTSQIFIYQKVGSAYNLIAFRNTVSGVVKARDSSEGLIFEIDGKLFLLLSWEGIEKQEKR